tara:strand:+ start:183 stop:365 length:183 start_codon:yes stop_codon:yes gene_type:complete
MIKVGDLVRLRQEALRPWLTSLWIVIDLQDTFDANGEVTIAFLRNGRQKYTQRTTLLEKL